MKGWQSSISAIAKKKKTSGKRTSLHQQYYYWNIMALSYSEVLCSGEASELQLYAKTKLNFKNIMLTKKGK